MTHMTNSTQILPSVPFTASVNDEAQSIRGMLLYFPEQIKVALTLPNGITIIGRYQKPESLADIDSMTRGALIDAFIQGMIAGAGATLLSPVIYEMEKICYRFENGQ